MKFNAKCLREDLTARVLARGFVLNTARLIHMDCVPCCSFGGSGCHPVILRPL